MAKSSGGVPHKRGIPKHIRDEQVFAYVRDYIKTNGFAPVVREIGPATNMHATTAWKSLQRLEENGFIRRLPGDRNIEILYAGAGK